MKRILVADDHPAMREGLKRILAAGIPGLQFGEACSTNQTLELLHQEKWHALVLDIFMPGRSGLEVLEEIHRDLPQLPVLVVSSASEAQLAVRVTRHGAAGFLNKEAAAEELVGAVHQLLAGGRYVSRKVAELLAGELSHCRKEAAAELSAREYEVLRHLLEGRSLKEIAAEMSLSAKTISTYHTRIWDKLGVHNDLSLARVAIEHGLIDLVAANPSADYGFDPRLRRSAL